MLNNSQLATTCTYKLHITEEHMPAQRCRFDLHENYITHMGFVNASKANFMTINHFTGVCLFIKACHMKTMGQAFSQYLHLGTQGHVMLFCKWWCWVYMYTWCTNTSWPHMKLLTKHDNGSLYVAFLVQMKLGRNSIVFWSARDVKTCGSSSASKN